jgi:putative ABC transport system permease protein
MDGWIQDGKYALRSILSAKRFAAIVIATLALGIGANTAVFSVLHAVVLQPLPYEEPERLVRVYKTSGADNSYLVGLAFIAMRERATTVDLAALYTYSVEGADLTERGRTERLRVLPVSSDYFRVLRVSPTHGRVFTRDDEIPPPGSSSSAAGAAAAAARTGERAPERLAVISDRIWREYLGAAPDAAGRVLTLNGIPHRIVAVLPGGFDDPLEPGVDIWTPLGLRPGGANSWDNHYLTAIGRLKPGVTLEQAQAEVRTIALGLEWNRARGTSDRPPNSMRIASLQTDTIGTAGPMLWTLLGAVTILLIVACVNVAGLFLARGAARESELAIRATLGCTRPRLIRQLLIESLLLSIGGGLAGLVLAHVVTRALLTAAPDTVARATASSLGAAALAGSWLGDSWLGGSPIGFTVFAFSAAIAIAAGIAFGIAPALQFTRVSLEGVLRESGRSGSGSRHHTRARNVLVAGQIALALVLLTGAGLLLRSFDRLRSVALGVQHANVITFEVNLPSGRYGLPESRARFHREFQARVAALPGVRAVGAVSRLPVTGSYHSWGTRRAGATPGTRSVSTDNRTIEGAYFEALRIPLVRGRMFNAEDAAAGPMRVVVSQDAARRLFGDEDPIGKGVVINGDPAEVIGVVRDVASTPRGAIRPTVYHSHWQYAGNRNWALKQVIAMDRPLPGLLGDVRRELAAIDPALVLHQPRALTEVIGGGIAQERFALLLVGGFALLALVLAAVGIYGVLSYAVTRRRREMGIRMALGAPARAVWSLVLRDGARLAGIGVVLGLAGAYAATRVLQTLLFGVSATDPIVFGLAAITLAAVALLASWIPARAATRVDPLTAVRADN